MSDLPIGLPNADLHVPAKVVVPATSINQQMKAQLRIVITAIDGALVLRYVLPTRM